MGSHHRQLRVCLMMINEHAQAHAASRRLALPTCPAQYENPIQRGRDADASDAQVAKGLTAMSELMGLINSFMLRRTSTVLKKLLPAKVEQVGAGGSPRPPPAVAPPPLCCLLRGA